MCLRTVYQTTVEQAENETLSCVITPQNPFEGRKNADDAHVRFASCFHNLLALLHVFYVIRRVLCNKACS